MVSNTWLLKSCAPRDASQFAGVPTNTSAESFSDAVSKLVGDSGSGRDRPRDARPLNRLAWQATADTNGEATPFIPERLVNWLRVLWPFLTA